MITGLIIGIVIGFLFSMPPLGPTYFAIIDKGLKKEFNNAVAIGAGAGFMDMIYILASFGGVSFISAILPQSVDDFFISNEGILKFYLGAIGCIIVILYGIKIMRGKKEPDKNIQNDEETKLALKKKLENAGNVLKRTEEGIGKIFRTKKAVNIHSDITGSFFVGIVMCLSSPTLPASWFATVGYLKSYGLLNSSFLTGILLGFGVLIGTTFWFYLMTKLIFKHSEKFNPKFMKKLNFATGIFLILLGVFFFIKITLAQFI